MVHLLFVIDAALQGPEEKRFESFNFEISPKEVVEKYIY